jgi:hypothetical protein
MDACLDEEARGAVMEACGRSCGWTGPASVASGCHGDLDQWLDVVAGWHGGEERVRRDANTVKVLCAECLCDLLKDAADGLSGTYCACSPWAG